MLRKWSISILLFFCACALVLAASATSFAQDMPPTPTAETGPDGETDGTQSPAVPTACTVPTSATIRGKSVQFDQCYEQTFSYDSTTYTIQVFYTEQNAQVNLDQCSATENSSNRCEHAIADDDNGNGDNVNVVLMADEAEDALKFYFDRNLDTISGTTLNIYIAEDPRLGGVIWPDSIYVDDEKMDANDDLEKRLLAYHEIQHLVQDKYDSGTGWLDFFGEGIARAIEDRVDTELDADTGHLFIPEVNDILGLDGQRTSDLSTISYDSVLWWTWLFDQYRSNSDSEPDIGWDAILDFYEELDTETDQLKALGDFISSEGSNFRDDFIDYTLSLFAYEFNPSDERLTYLDNEILNNTNGLSGHVVMTSGPSFGEISLTMNPRSSRYVEFNPANQCDFISFTFDGNGDPYGFSVMTVDGGNLQERWTSYSDSWQRTVRSSDLDSVVGVVSAFDQSGSIDLGRGCVSPKLNIKNPTTSQFEMVGEADNPRNFIVRLDVDGEDGSGVAGLVASDFTVELQPAGGGAALPATIVNATYVQDDYWLLVTPPDDADGAQTGTFYNLTVSLGSQSDTENSAVLYVKRTQDVMIVLDRSGSMSFASGKIQAARNAAELFVNELADDDQGGYVAFDTTAVLEVGLDEVGSGAGSHRFDLEAAIASETPQLATSIGDGMETAADEHDSEGDSDNMCSFVLLSDGYENEDPKWADVQADVVDNGCAIHTVALGPEANELLMQQIAGASPGGSYDYADVNGNVPLAQLDDQSLQGVEGISADFLGWQNYLSRVYDAKAAQIAGRQRLYSAQDFGSDNEEFQDYRFYVDPTSGEMVIAVAWQSPIKGEQKLTLFDPDGNEVEPDSRRFSPNATNEVLRVKEPAEGFWRLRVENIFQEYYVSVTGETNVEMYLFVGTPIDDLEQGVKVPLLATFVGPGLPVVGADVVANVRAPNGLVTPVKLYDDGNHGDAEPDDGVYGGFYTTTLSADAEVPQEVVEGEEPDAVGSYLVSAVGTIGQIRREAQGSFAIQPGADDNNNGLPDAWEREHGVKDPKADDDGDKLVNACELQIGTDPNNPDTDGGGESDGSEVPNCKLGDKDPFDPSDDRVGPFPWVIIWPELLNRIPVIVIDWGEPDRGTLQYVEIYRRVFENGKLVQDWQLIGEEVEGDSYTDEEVKPGFEFQYRVIPFIMGEGGMVRMGNAVDSTSAEPSEDPYAPGGSVLINDGDATTDSQKVTLSISADDIYGEHDGGETLVLPGTPTDELEMRLSNSNDFSGVAWQPFSATVEDWMLDVEPGGTAVVHVQFRDEAGNVSEDGFGLKDSIIYEPGDGMTYLFLPVVRQP